MLNIKRLLTNLPLTLSLAAATLTASPAAGQEPFRVKSNAVPVDVTVLDDQGIPILGLTAADFEVLEDGVPQKLDFFLAPEPNRSTAGGSELAGSSAGVRAAQPRHFLFLMGNIGYDEFDSIRNVADFVEKLGPNDRVALMAFRRVGEFTNDHEKTAAAIRRYEKVNAKVNAQLQVIRQLFIFNLAGATSDSMPKTVRQTVREFFIDSGLRSLELPRATFENIEVELEDRDRFDLNSLERLVNASPSGALDADFRMRLFPGQGRIGPDGFDRDRISLLGSAPWTAGANLRFSTAFDYSQMITAIEHLSYLDGDKHLFFFTDEGLGWTHDDLGRFAASNRVRLHLFQSGGVAGASLVFGDYPGRSNTRIGSGVDRFGLPLRVRSSATFRSDNSLLSNLAASTLAPLARQTGGTSSIHSRVGPTLNKALQAIDSTYRLSYVPTDTNWDGKYREIEVRVKREKATLSHRRGYLGVEPSTERERLDNLILLRTVAAFKQPEYVKEIPLELTLAQPLDEKGSGMYEVRLKARFSEGTFRRSNGSREAELAIAYFLLRGREVVSVQDRVNLRMTEPEYQTALRDGFDFTRPLPVPKSMAGGLLKVVAYLPEGDLLGSVNLKLPK